MVIVIDVVLVQQTVERGLIVAAVLTIVAVVDVVLVVVVASVELGGQRRHRRLSDHVRQGVGRRRRDVAIVADSIVVAEATRRLILDGMGRIQDNDVLVHKLNGVDDSLLLYSKKVFRELCV